MTISFLVWKQLLERQPARLAECGTEFYNYVLTLITNYVHVATSVGYPPSLACTLLPCPGFPANFIGAVCKDIPSEDDGGLHIKVKCTCLLQTVC